MTAERRQREREGHEARLRRLARRERFVVSHEELLAAGLSASAIVRRRGSALTPVFRDVYLVERMRPTEDELLRAAIKAGGAGTVLGFRSAADHWNTLTWHGPVETITPTHRRRQSRLHPRQRILHPADVTTRGGLPITTLARTYVDVAGLLTLDELDRAVHEAEFRGLLRPLAIEQAMARAGRFVGRPNLAAALTRRRPLDGRLDSGEEKRFFFFLRDRRYPHAVHNRTFELDDGERVSVDVLFPDHWLGIEIDGGPHKTPRRHDEDRRRDRRLRAVHQLPIIRVTDTDLTVRPDEVDGDLRVELARREGMAARLGRSA